MNPRVHIFVNGILTFPGSSRNWTGRAVTWTHLNTEARAEKVEYFCGPIGRALGQRERAEKFAATLQHYQGWQAIAVGHSNGADVILDGLRLAAWPRLEELHLVCGACEADFNTNGLNLALLNDRIGKVFVYIGDRDQALRLAHTLPAQLLGYGVLGLHGPRNVRANVRDRVGELHWPDYGHSDCWHDDHFAQTMKHFTGAMEVVA